MSALDKLEVATTQVLSMFDNMLMKSGVQEDSQELLEQKRRMRLKAKW